MPILLPESYGDEFAFSADEALHPEFWEPHRPVSVFCPLIGSTGNKLIDYVGGAPMTINNYASSMWDSNGLNFNGTVSNSRAAVTKLFSDYPFTIIWSAKRVIVGLQACVCIGYTGSSYTLISGFSSSSLWIRDYGTTDRTRTKTIGTETGVVAAFVFKPLERHMWLNGDGKVSDTTGASGNSGPFTQATIGKSTGASGFYPYEGLLRTAIIYNHELQDAKVSLLSQKLKNDPLAPFRKRPVRKFLFLSDIPAAAGRILKRKIPNNFRIGRL